MPVRGIAEFPEKFDQDKNWSGVRRILMDMRQNILDMLGAVSTPRAPVGLKAVAASFANIIQFIRTDGDYYEVLWSPTQNLKDAYPTDIGDTGQWVDYTGKDAITRYYWVRAVNVVGSHSRMRSNLTGPVTATTLTVAAAVTPPAAPVLGDQLVIDQTTGFKVQNPSKAG